MLIPRKLAGLRVVRSAAHNTFNVKWNDLNIEDLLFYIFSAFPPWFTYVAYATPDNKTKHEIIIEYRAKLIADGIIDTDDFTVSNASLIPELARVSICSSDHMNKSLTVSSQSVSFYSIPSW